MSIRPPKFLQPLDIHGNTDRQPPQPPPCAKNLRPPDIEANLKSILNGTISDLLEKYSVAGYSEEEMATYLADFSFRIQSVCEEEVKAEQSILDLGLEQTQSFEQNIKQLLSTMGRHNETLFIYTDSKKSYNCRLNLLKYQMDCLVEEKSVRTDQLENMKAQVNHLVVELGEKVVDLPEGYEKEEVDLSDDAFKTMSDNFDVLIALKKKRKAKMECICNQCYSLYTQLSLLTEGFSTLPDHLPHHTLDQQIISFVESNSEILPFSLHSSDLNLLQSRLQALENEKSRRRDILAKLGNSIGKLWSSLRISTMERQDFQASFGTTLSMETIQKGKSELLRLKSLRCRDLPKKIERIREDILRLWNECQVDNDERRRIECPIYYKSVEELDDEAVLTIILGIDIMFHWNLL